MRVTGRSRLIALVVAVIAVGAIAAAVAWTSGDDEAPPTATPSASSSPGTASSTTRVQDIGVPERLVVASIGVDAPVIEVGTTDDNAQDVPDSLTDTGWWRDGQRPGQAGNAVIVGHTASRSSGVFDRLGEVRKGDVVVVSSSSGSIRYTVTETDEIAVADFATVAPDVYRRTGASGVVLMTCGDFDGTRFTTTVIVHAEARTS